MSDLVFPTIHLNGTSAEFLLEDIACANGLLRDSLVALQRCTPNARDYYMTNNLNLAGDRFVFQRAMAQHAARLASVQAVIMELDAIAVNIDRQEAERQARKAR